MDRPTTQRRPLRLAFHASRIVIDIGVLIVLGSMSLPFVVSDAGNRSAITADALPTLLLVLPIFAVTLIPDHSRPLPPLLGWLSLMLAVAALPYSVVKYFDASTVAETIDGTVGMGARLLVFGTLVIVAGIVIGLARTILRLPSGGTYPKQVAEPAASRRSPRAGAERPGPAGGRKPATSGAQRGAPRASDPRRAAAPRPETPPSQDPASRTARAARSGGDQQAARSAGTRPTPPAGAQPARRPAPQSDEPRRPTSQSDEPRRPAPPERAASVPPRPRIAPPSVRRPVISSRPDHDALPEPKRPTGELPGAGTGDPRPRRPVRDDDGGETDPRDDT